MTTTIPQAQRRKEQKRRKRGLLIWGSVAAIGALITSAAFVDSEWAHLDSHATAEHNLKVRVAGQEDWTDTTKGTPLDVDMSDGKLLPGGATALTGAYDVKNTSDHYGSTLWIAMDEEENVPEHSEHLRDALRFKIKVGDQQVLNDSAGQVLTYADLDGDGIQLDNMTVGEDRPVTIATTLEDMGPGNEHLEDVEAHLLVQLYGTAVETT